MLNSLFQTICRVGIFMICAQAIIHFRPQEAYEKYMKLLVSVMILVQLLLSAGKIFLGEGMEETLRSLVRLQEELELELEQAAQEAADADRMLESMTLEEIRERLEEQETAGEGQEEAGGAESNDDGDEIRDEDGGLKGKDGAAGGGEQSPEDVSQISVGNISVKVE